jgi:hypothetical protein
LANEKETSMEIKVLCNCGQKFKFDVEPVSGRMPFAVNCPVCGTDGTPSANAILAQSVSPPPPPPPMAARLQANQPEPSPPTAAPPAFYPRPPAVAIGVLSPAKVKGKCNLALGIAGALIGAGIGAGVMYAFYQWAGFRFPLLGVGIGILTGFGGKLLSKGTSNTLGMICGAIAMVAVVAALYLMYGEFPIVSIISVIVSVSVSYRISSG